MEARVLQICDKNIKFTVDQENLKFKTTFRRDMDDTVKSATQKLEFALLKKIKEVSDQLQVEDLIGTSATFYDFKDYA